MKREAEKIMMKLLPVRVHPFTLTQGSICVEVEEWVSEIR